MLGTSAPGRHTEPQRPPSKDDLFTWVTARQKGTIKGKVSFSIRALSLNFQFCLGRAPAPSFLRQESFFIPSRCSITPLLLNFCHVSVW